MIPSVFKRVLVLFSLCVASAFAQNARYDNVAFTSGGLNAAFIANATITVCTSAGSGLPCTPKVSGLCVSATDVACNAPNPTTSDAFGNYGFWIQPGTYVISVTKAGLTGFSTTLTLPCQPTSACTITGSLTVGGAGTAGLWNGVCIVDGVKNATLAAAVTCAGTSGVIEIPMFAVPTLTANVTIPAGVTLKFDGGSPGLIQLGNFNLTINGPLVAPNAQVFSYTGTGVVFLSNPANPVNVLWFPGADIGAQVNNAFAALPTISSNDGNSYANGILTLPTGVYTQSTTVSLNSPFLTVIGPGSGALKFNCAINGDCWNYHLKAAGTLSPGRVGPIISGFSVVGQGASNASAVGFHMGDMMGAVISDIKTSDFAGTSSACFWFDNIIGFTERSWFNTLSAGLAPNDGSASPPFSTGCTKAYRWSNTGNVAGTSSFGHNHWSANKADIKAGQTALSFDGGTIYDSFFQFTVSVDSGTTATVVALSGLQYTGGNNTQVDGSFDINAECANSCTAGTLINLPSGYNISLNSGYIWDSSNHLTNTGTGSVNRYLNSRAFGMNGEGIIISGVGTVGAGIPGILGVTVQNTLTANLSPVTLYTTLTTGTGAGVWGAQGQYRICATAYESVSGTATAIQIVVGSQPVGAGVTQSFNLGPVLSLASTNGTGGCANVRAVANSPITVSTTGYSGTGTYNLEASVEQICGPSTSC